MKIGCFALVEPFTGMARQFEAIAEMGIKYADVTDNHNGGMLGATYGFAASVSLDSHPATIRGMAESAGVELTAFCAHANLLDPAAPDVYGTADIIKAVKLASQLGIKHVITTDGDPKTVLAEIESLWRESGDLPDDEYVCVVDSTSALVHHTAHPSSAGNNAGRNTLMDIPGGGTGQLRDLVKSGDIY